MEFEVPESFTTTVIDANMTGCHLCQIADSVRISPRFSFPVPGFTSTHAVCG